MVTTVWRPCATATWSSKQTAHLQLVWQILGEPRVGLDSCNGDPVGGVAHKDLAHHVQALPGDVQVCGEAVLHSHDPLQQCICVLQTNDSALWKQRNSLRKVTKGGDCMCNGERDRSIQNDAKHCSCRQPHSRCDNTHCLSNTSVM